MIGVSFDLPFNEQLASFRQKGFALSPESWRDVWQDAHARAFTVAQVTKADVLKDIRGALDDAMEKGLTARDFRAGLRETLEKKGWLAPRGEKAKVTLPDGTTRKRLTAWRLGLIYDTNLQSAYSVGRFKQMKEIQSVRPYWQYMTAGDAAVRKSHATHHGKIRHADHPFWDEWYPPNGFRCRCYVRTLSKAEMKRRGLEEETRGTSETPDEGFRYNPGEAGLAAWQPDLAEYPQLLAARLSGALSAQRKAPEEGIREI